MEAVIGLSSMNKQLLTTMVFLLLVVHVTLVTEIVDILPREFTTTMLGKTYVPLLHHPMVSSDLYYTQLQKPLTMKNHNA